MYFFAGFEKQLAAVYSQLSDPHGPLYMVSPNGPTIGDFDAADVCFATSALYKQMLGKDIAAEYPLLEKFLAAVRGLPQFSLGLATFRQTTRWPGGGVNPSKLSDIHQEATEETGRI